MTDNRTTERVDHPPRVREAIDELMRKKDATDNRTTELLDGLRSVGNLHEFAELFGFNWEDDSDWTWHDVAVKMADELEQAIAATLGNSRAERTCAECAEGMGRYADSLCDPLKQRIAELEEQRDMLLRCLENDWNISASWDGLRRFWYIGLTEEGVRLRDTELNSRAERTCECVAEYAESPIDGKKIVLHRCSACHELMRTHMRYCPNCGCKVVGE